MISTTEAKELIRESIQALPAVRMPLAKAVGLTLAEDLYARIDIPAFPQSSMDGYALSFAGWTQHKELLIEGEMAAGSREVFEGRPQKAVRIFTGAAVPAGFDTVIMQEKVRKENGKLFIEDEHLQQGANVRPKGSEIEAGALALTKRSRLTPAAIGFLAGLGIDNVLVYPYPSVSVIITGNELQQPGTKLEYGQVYDSNSFTLRAVLKQLHITDVTIQHVPDDQDALTSALQDALQDSDVILLTGGVSAGDYDYVPGAAARSGVDTIFHKVKQRPGKPLFFGKKGQKPVFGLPGNPSSVLTCFYQYVLPALEKMTGVPFSLTTIKAPLGKDYQKATQLTHYLKGHYDGQQVIPLGGQESYRMHSFAQSNCLIEIGEQVKELSTGSLVEVHLLPV